MLLCKRVATRDASVFLCFEKHLRFVDLLDEVLCFSSSLRFPSSSQSLAHCQTTCCES
jgi:hypothetical protein